jgi:hypothetical protein
MGEIVSVKNVEAPVSLRTGYSSQDLVGVRELGFNDRGAFVVDGWTTPPGTRRGAYFTGLPISPVDFRRTHRTEAAFTRGKGGLVIYCDWGRKHIIDAPADVLDALVSECVAHELPERAS